MSHPIAEALLTSYWLDDLAPAEAEAVEAHVFACAECAAKLRSMAELIDGLRELVRAAPPPILSRSDLAALRGRGVELFEVCPGRASRVQIEIPHTAAVCIVRLPIERGDLDTVDVALSKPDEAPFLLLADVPLEPDSDEVIVACSRHVAAAHAQLRLVVRGRVGAVERVLADCTLVTGV